MGTDLWGLRKNSGSWPLSRLDCDCGQHQGAVLIAAGRISFDICPCRAPVMVRKIALVLGRFSQQWLLSWMGICFLLLAHSAFGQ